VTDLYDCTHAASDSFAFGGALVVRVVSGGEYRLANGLFAIGDTEVDDSVSAVGVPETTTETAGTDGGPGTISARDGIATPFTAAAWALGQACTSFSVSRRASFAFFLLRLKRKTNAMPIKINRTIPPPDDFPCSCEGGVFTEVEGAIRDEAGASRG
jgi:hypothetical protein